MDIYIYILTYLFSLEVTLVLGAYEKFPRPIWAYLNIQSILWHIVPLPWGTRCWHKNVWRLYPNTPNSFSVHGFLGAFGIWPAKRNHHLTEWLTALLIWRDECVSVCQSTHRCWAGIGLVALFSSLFQPLLFNHRFPLLSFPGSVAMVTVSLDHAAFLPSGLPLSASHQQGFTHIRSSPLKLLYRHACR